MHTKEPSLLGKFLHVGLMLIKRCKLLFTLLIFVSIVSSILGVFVPLVIGEMTNSLQGGHISESFPFCYFNTPIKITLFFIVCGFLKIVSSFAAGLVDRFFQNILTLHLKSKLHDKILSLDAFYHNDHDQGENLFNINNSASVVGTISMLFVLPVSCLIGLYLAISSLYQSMSSVQIPLWLSLCIIPALFAQPFVGYWLGEKINSAFGLLRASNMAVNEELLNSLKAPTEVQVMSAEPQRSTSVFSALKKVVRASNKANTLSILDNQFTSICILFFQGLIAFVIAYFYLQSDQASTGVAGSLIVCIMLIPELFNQLAGFIATYIQTKQSEPEITTIYALLSLESKVKEQADAIDFPAADEVSIGIENMDFSYTPEKKILQKLNVTFPANQTTAIVSRSGGGKSTLLHLLSRLYDPECGRICVNGNDLKNLKIASLRQSIVRISQFPLFIQGSLRDNFKLQKIDITDQEIEKACREVGLWDTICTQSGNTPFDFALSLGAENLSGGQRRLLAIARAMVTSPSVLVLDEPTTGVDAQTIRNAIYPLLETLKKKCTIVFIDHNMNFVRSLADRILVLDQGCASACGPTEEVLENKDSLFYKLWSEYNTGNKS